MAHPNDELLQRFYAAFDAKDGDAMAACYLHEGHFHDPVFGDLSGAEAGDMWRMLTSRAADLRVELAAHEANDTTGSANWIATYTFAQTGRKVVNDIQASFRFADGLIAEHIDRFSFWTWSRQALGPAGLLLGWTPVLRGKVGAQARKGLDDYREVG
ncbi:MAG: nuclear transport factor 2 family protein [Solirubrobacteraceae bacterium]